MGNGGGDSSRGHKELERQKKTDPVGLAKTDGVVKCDENGGCSWGDERH